MSTDDVDVEFSYRVVDKGGNAPEGYTYLRRDPGPIAGFRAGSAGSLEILVPVASAKRLAQQCNAAEQHKAEKKALRLEQKLNDQLLEARADAIVAPAPAPSPSAVSYQPGVRKNDPYFVAMPDEDIWPRPEIGARVVGVFSIDDLLHAVAGHNNRTTGSADERDRQRAAEVLRMQVERGPWRVGAGPTDHNAVQEVLAALDEELGHLGDGAIAEATRVALATAEARAEPVRLQPHLLIGGPGSGKTYGARRWGQLVGLSTRMVDCTSLSTTCTFSGSSFHWATSALGLLAEEVLLGSSPNPFFVLDEIEKISTGGRYNPQHSLLPVLERESCKAVKDNCLPALTFDASFASYCSTANCLDGLPAPLLSRFQLVLVREPTSSQRHRIATAICKRVFAGVERLAGTKPPRDVLRVLCEFSPRRMNQLVEVGVGRMLAEGASRLTVEHLSGSLERRRLH